MSPGHTATLVVRTLPPSRPTLDSPPAAGHAGHIHCPHVVERSCFPSGWGGGSPVSLCPKGDDLWRI